MHAASVGRRGKITQRQFVPGRGTTLREVVAGGRIVWNIVAGSVTSFGAFPDHFSVRVLAARSMQVPIHKLAVLAVCCSLAPAAGCTATADGARGLFEKLSWKQTPEEALHIKTPDDYLEELRELAKTAHKKSAEEQARISARLAEDIKREQEPSVRRHILRTLAAYRTPVSAAILKAALADADVEVRRVACECLGIQGGPQAVQELARVATADTDIDVRIAAVRALGQTRDQTALAPLAEALVDPDPAVQFRAQQSLRSVSGRDFGNDVKAWREYARTGKSDAPEVNFAERMRRALF
jgi:HEAT repeat protein